MTEIATAPPASTGQQQAEEPPPFPGLHFDVPLDRVFLSPFYQRIETQDENFIKALVRDWDPRMFGSVLCSAREGEGEVERYACIDGGHRLAAARVKGYQLAPAEVLFGLSEREEAELCLAINHRRRGFSAYDRWLIERNLGNPDVLELERILGKYRLEAAPNRGPRANTARSVRALAALRSAYAKAGGEAVDGALAALMRTWGLQQLSGDFIKALAYFLHSYPEVTSGAMAESLRRIDPDELQVQIRAAGRSGGGVQGPRVVDTLRRLYNHGRDPEDKLAK